MKLANLVSKYGDYEVSEEQLKKILKINRTHEGIVDGDSYYYCGDLGEIISTTWSSSYEDGQRLKIGNVYLNKEDAIVKMEERYCAQLLLQNGGRKDFYFSKMNWYLVYDFEKNCIDSRCSVNEKIGGVIYFDTLEDASHALRKVGRKNYLKYILKISE